LIETLNFKSHVLNENRDIYVYLPSSYNEDFPGGYPVLYMMDGQNIFSNETGAMHSWDLDITADRLIEQGLIEPIVIVGVAHGLGRDDEYTPTFDHEEGSGGYADIHLEFLINELMPAVANEYNISGEYFDTAICGSSLGGLFTIYAMIKYSGIFGKIGSISPSLWWDNKVIFEMAANWESEHSLPVFWLDMGVNETDEDDVVPDEEYEYDDQGDDDPDACLRANNNFDETDPLDDVRNFRDLLKAIGFDEEENFAYFEDAWGYHDEMSWGIRMDKVLEFLFGKWRMINTI
jgi:predicted alpha/beta superfamily hydrolase